MAAAEEQPGAINDEIRAHLALDEMVVVDLGGMRPEDDPNPTSCTNWESATLQVAVYRLCFHASKAAAWLEVRWGRPKEVHLRPLRRFHSMKTIQELAQQAGGVGSYGLLWLLGVPLPILLIIYLLRGH